jgi:hypothetical protein
MALHGKGWKYGGGREAREGVWKGIGGKWEGKDVERRGSIGSERKEGEGREEREKRERRESEDHTHLSTNMERNWRRSMTTNTTGT